MNFKTRRAVFHACVFVCECMCLCPDNLSFKSFSSEQGVPACFASELTGPLQGIRVRVPPEKRHLFYPLSVLPELNPSFL